MLVLVPLIPSPLWGQGRAHAEHTGPQAGVPARIPSAAPWSFGAFVSPPASVSQPGRVSVLGRFSRLCGEGGQAGHGGGCCWDLCPAQTPALLPAEVAQASCASQTLTCSRFPGSLVKTLILQ